MDLASGEFFGGLIHDQLTWFAIWKKYFWQKKIIILSISVQKEKYIICVDEKKTNKKRQFLQRKLFLVGVIVFPDGPAMLNSF